MDWQDFPYARWNPEDGYVECRPEIPLRAVGVDGKEVEFRGLVDSGASRCLINSVFMEDLGVDPGFCTETRIGGLGGPGTMGLYYSAGIRFILDDMGAEFVCPVVFGDITVPCILGQDDFFLHFDVKFERAKGIFSLKLVPKLMDDIKF